MYSLLIRNATIAHPDGSTTPGDVACAAGKIACIAKNIFAPAEETIDAAGKLLLPGVIDPQVHFREPGKEYKEDLRSGSRAAARGGVTSFLDMPNTDPATINQQALNDKLARAARKSVVNYGFFIGATKDNLDELNRAAPACGIKIFMGASTGSLLVNRAEDIERIFAHVWISRREAGAGSAQTSLRSLIVPSPARCSRRLPLRHRRAPGASMANRGGPRTVDAAGSLRCRGTRSPRRRANTSRVRGTSNLPQK